MKSVFLSILLLALFNSAEYSQSQYKIMSYNILNYPGSTSSIRNPYFQTTIAGVLPDILVVQEMLSQAGVDEFKNNVLNVISSGYAAGTFINGPDTDNAIFFKSAAFSFLAHNVITTALRNISEFVLSENTTGDTIRIYSLHLKASTGSTNQQKRLAEVIALRNVTDTLPLNSNFIICGDFNIYSSNEPAYQKLLDQSTQGYFLDIFNLSGTWNNSIYAPYHTQSPRTRQFGGGANGGMDDRFDMILMSQGVIDTGGIYYIPDSFVSYGNDGNHYNDSINRPPNIAVGQTIANAIHYASDHIPIYGYFSFNNQAPLSFPLTVDVEDGWNMVSIPGLHPTNQDVTTWWSNLTGSVFKYSGGYLPVTTATPAEGYWMKNSGANVYNTGDEWPASGIQIVSHDPISVTVGWNIIGGYENSAAVSGLTTTPPGLINGPVYGYTSSGGYKVATNLVPGYAYWIPLSGPGLINIPSAPLSKGSSKVVEYFKEEWGKITITDNAGRSYTLYAVRGEVDLDNYELPPMPPVGMFDIRYGSGRIAEDINSGIQSIDMTGIEYPIIVKVENMDIRLQDETGNQINENIKSGEEITISNTSISKLMVTGEMIPDVYALEQNYPNPFNPSTTIEFSLPEDVNNVMLTIYDILGQRVTQLVNTSLKAGKYSYQWNAGHIATGMYIYELRASSATGGFVSVKKMILLK
jgi:endonuclease/exonuclease/phosphatase family metal-dependent hydrolase